MPIDAARIRAIFFDVDGTLSDTDDLWTEQLSARLRPLARLLPHRDPHAFARRMIMAAETPGNLALSVLDFLGLDGPLMALADWQARRGLTHKRGVFRLMDQVDRLLPALAERYPLAVISANTEATTLAFLDQFNLRPFFRCVATANTCPHAKPYPDQLFWAAEQLGVAPEACLMVGDTTVDIRAGRAAGAQTAGVLCGFGEEAELRRSGAGIILPRTADLLSVLL